jgi:hypothetical protein
LVDLGAALFVGFDGNFFARPEASLPAAQMTVSQEIGPLLSVTIPASMFWTGSASLTSTPRDSSCLTALAERSSG